MSRHGGPGTQAASFTRHPNVVVILADDMGWGDLGCYGATAIPTPRMDALAEQGVRMTDAHSSSSVCTPSRYSLLTGRYAWRSPLKQHVLHGHGPAIIEPGRATIASELKAAGYRTGAFGKWHLGLDWTRKDGSVVTAFGPGAVDDMLDHPDQYLHDDIDYTVPFAGGPCELGFDTFFGIAGSLNMPPYCFLSQDRTLGIPDRPKEQYVTSQLRGLQVADWQDDQVDLRFAEESVDWIRESVAADEPFFAYVATAAPHRPCVPPAQFQGLSEAGARGDSVCLVDWMVGQIDDVLNELGIQDDTIVIVTSDNGAPTRFPEDGDVENHRPNGPYRGQKGDVWDGGHREPLLIRWPAGLKAGAVRDDLVCLSDLYPMVLAAAGLTPTSGAAEDAVDLLSRLRKPATTLRGRPVVHHTLRGSFGLRTEQYKVNFCVGSGGGFSEPVGESFSGQTPLGQIYDITADPYETTNLWDSRLDIAREAQRMLAVITAGAATGFESDVVPLAAGESDKR
ncbi:sulfatase family protein (plasmid) [Coraliomargarita sp. W4R53]